MILNKTNWFAIYHNWVYGNYPKNICSFFWNTLMGIILFPLILPGKGITRMSDDDNDDDLQTNILFLTVMGFCCYLALFIIGGIGNIVLEEIFGYVFIYVWSAIIGGIGLGILFLNIIVIAVWMILKLFKRAGNNISETYIIDNTVDFIAGVKENYCTRITWIDETTTTE